MMNKLVLVGVGAAGYVLGAKAGRERYDQIARTARRWRNDPRVQEKTSEAADLVRHKAPEVREHVTNAAKETAQHLRSRNGHDSAPGAER